MIALAVVSVGLIWARTPALPLGVGLVLLVVPLMLLFLRGGGHDDGSGLGVVQRVRVSHRHDTTSR